MAFRRLLHAAIAAALLGAGPSALSQPPGAPAAEVSPRFEIRRFIFDGASLVPLERLEQVTRPYLGKNRNFADVQRALEAIERAYADSGYNAVQVLLPEQVLERGEIHFRIIEAKIRQVSIEGNKYFDAANISASVPSLVPRTAPNVKAINRSLRVANESPAKQETVVLRSTEEEGTVDAVVQVTDRPPRRVSISLDNSGTPQTGLFRVGVGYQDANVGGRDHVLTLQYVGAPNQREHPDSLSLVPSSGVFIVGAGYRIPLYSLGDSLDFAAGYSNVSSGIVANLFSVTGAGSIASARYTHNLEGSDTYEHRVAFSLDHRAYQNAGVRALATNQQLIPNITVHPATVLYSGTLRRQGSVSTFSFGLSQNLPGGNAGGAADFCASRSNGLGQCAGADYRIWRWGFEHVHTLPADWQLRLAASGQWTRDMLVVGEQFALGGADSVRGFREREILDDRGYRGSAELYAPDFSSRTGIAQARSRALLFLDWGGVRRNNPGPGEIGGEHVGSYGVGLRFWHGDNLSLRLDYGIVFDGGGTEGVGHGRLHASIAYVF